MLTLNDYNQNNFNTNRLTKSISMYQSSSSTKSMANNYHHLNHNHNNNPLILMIKNFGWLTLMIILVFVWKQSLNPFNSSIDSNSNNLMNSNQLSVEAFFFDKFERFKRITLPTAFSGLSSLLPGLSSPGIRVCINFNSQYPQGYQQNTCFLCDVYRFNSIAYQCTGQTQIPGNINFTQANCIMNSCQPMMYGAGAGGGIGGGGSFMTNRYQLPINIGHLTLPPSSSSSSLPQPKFGLFQSQALLQQHYQQQLQLQQQQQQQQLQQQQQQQQEQQQQQNKPIP
ncbi:hypothetical protein DERP_009027 [Dermatophagoides pteronyssinus]|uniref:Uncharacterized protein n=1 Tax=Dermatophagoides pteronyssinus TaxID=6956 RepID=A0ABQ8JG73_DERPT|nr:hypothetical protein DERP_009027 [Dermatophagoides pteronyssinus]